MRAATAFVYCNGRVLLLRRSRLMRSMPGLWAAVSGVVEGSEDTLERARTEIYEETGMDNVRPLASCAPVAIPHHDIVVHPFLFGAYDGVVRLNWENDLYAWIRPTDIVRYRTVPRLDVMLLCLLGGVGALAGQHDIDAGPTAHRARNVVPRVLASAGVYAGGLFGIDG